MTAGPIPEPSRLHRELGLLDAVAIGFGAIVGAGIFVVSGVAAGIAGPSFLVGLLIAAVAASCNALSSAQLAAAYPQSGGSYEYGYRVLHPWAGFVAGWMFLASKIAAAGTVALGLAAYLHTLLPGISPRIVAVGAVLLFTLLNYFGIRRSSRVNLVIVALSLGVLLLFVAGGVTSFRAGNLRPFWPAGWRGTLQSAALLFFAYTGYARIATLAEEVREPRQTIPRAIVITLSGAVALYVAVALVAVGAVGSARLAATAAPLRVAAEALPHPWMPAAVSLGGVAAMLGVILSQLLGLSRMVFAMATRGDLPRFLERVDPRRGVPGRAVLAVGGVAAVVAASGSLRGIASASAFTILVYYAITNLAALRMPRRAKRYPDAIAGAGLVGCLVLALSLSPPIILTGLGVLTLGAGARALLRR